MKTNENNFKKLNNHEKEQAFRTKKEQMKKKYQKNIESFCKYHGVDLFIGWDMLFFNAKCFASAITKEIIPGGGNINVPELVKDYNELAKYIQWQE